MTSFDTQTQILSRDKGFDFISKVSVEKKSSGSGRGQTSLVSSYQLDNCHNLNKIEEGALVDHKRSYFYGIQV